LPGNLSPHTASDIAPNIDRENNKLKSTKAHEALSTFFQHLETYTDACTAKEETPAATKAYNIASTLFSDININIERNLKVDIRAAHEVVDTLCASVVRNPDAALLLAQLKTTGKELYDNAIKTSVHLLAFGRHIGLPRKELSILGLGGLLMDIGKLRLPKDIQTKSNLFLKPAERKLIKQHVCYGEEIIAQSTDIPEEVSKIIAQHHERENGSGYPHGLYVNKLHAYGRMAAIVDCYEELIAPQPGMPSLRPFQAFKELRDNSNSGLNYTLVEQFTQCIGMFPVGSLVELNTGEVAIVLTHNRTQRFLPSVMIICDAKKKPYGTPITLDLRTTAPGPGGAQYTITRDLPQGAYGIDAKQYYL
jgi:HD-GYP domain-containing protein (c-di-GMP phosphodiesterase class II)